MLSCTRVQVNSFGRWKTGSVDSQERLVEQAGAKERQWTEGWLKISETDVRWQSVHRLGTEIQQ